MVNLLSSTGLRKQKNNILSNEDIKNIYIENYNNSSQEWQEKLFESISPLAINRIKKNKYFYEKDDLLQSIYLEIWKGIKTFDPYKNFDFYRWISWHINTASRNFIKKQKDFCSINVLYQSTFFEPVLQDELCFLNEIIDGRIELSEREKRIFFGYAAQGKTLSEIGIEENYSYEHIRKLYFNIIKKIQKEI